MRVRQLNPVAGGADHKQVLQDINKAMRGNISYGSGVNGDVIQNIDGCFATATTPGVANTEFSVPHILGRVPIGYHVITKNGSTDVYQGSTAWTVTEIFLKATGVNINIKLFIF